MAKVSEREILKGIQNALNPKGGSITVDSSTSNVEEWDSLGHLGVLVTLDQIFDGKVASIKEMATAGSVQKILQVLKDNSLV